MPEQVAALVVSSYERPVLENSVFRVLDASGLKISSGLNVLVKPNLLLAQKLACSSPQVVACACQWLLEHGARITICDSPAFGRATTVARAIGLDAALKPLGLTVNNFGKIRKVALPMPGHVRVGLAEEALEADLILSIPRLKAHAQMRITLAVKNCFGCVCGPAKALIHARFGESTERFADVVAAVSAALPPAAGLCDGIIAMGGTGPSKGDAIGLGILAASESAVALDAGLLEILRINPEIVPLTRALLRRGVAPEVVWPLAKPADFDARGFEIPETLKEISFNPLRLFKSVVKRAWLDWRG